MAVAPAPLTLGVTSASLFKNGYAVVVREAPLSGNGEYVIEDMPRAVLGTMWISATPGTKINSAIVTNQETETETPAQTLEDILRANIGKTLTLRTTFNEREYRGEILAANSNMVLIKELGGTRAINRSQARVSFGPAVKKVCNPSNW
jgi:hypothetical protein